MSKTTSTDFVIAPHPRLRGLHVATGDSGHGWKFLTIIGDLILDSMEGNLDNELAQRWAWEPKGVDNGSTAGMGGPLTELQPVVRSRDRLEINRTQAYRGSHHSNSDTQMARL